MGGPNGTTRGAGGLMAANFSFMPFSAIGGGVWSKKWIGRRLSVGERGWGLGERG